MKRMEGAHHIIAWGGAFFIGNGESFEHSLRCQRGGPEEKKIPILKSKGKTL
jgi:hypothetical protein